MAIPAEANSNVAWSAECDLRTAPSLVDMISYSSIYTLVAMAEALAVVGVVSSIVGLVDFSSKVLHRLNEFQSSRGEIPESFKHIKEKLPILLETLNQTKLAVEKGSTKEETREALSSAVDGCQTQITLLNDLIGRSLPQEGDSWRKKASKAISSLRQDAKVTKITTTIRSHIQDLTNYLSASSASQTANGMTV